MTCPQITCQKFIHGGVLRLEPVSVSRSSIYVVFFAGKYNAPALSVLLTCRSLPPSLSPVRIEVYGSGRCAMVAFSQGMRENSSPLTLAADLSVKRQAAPPAHLRLLALLARFQELPHGLGSQALEVVVVNLVDGGRWTRGEGGGGGVRCVTTQKKT